MPTNKPESPKPAAVAPPSAPATAPGAGAAPPPPPEPSSPLEPECAECGGPVKLYEGFNPHKAGQAWCLKENARRPYIGLD